MAIELTSILMASNVAELLDDTSKIGHAALEGYKQDRQSRKAWEERSAEAMKLALQVVEKKTFPFEGAANVKLPILTIATLQFHARAYPALISGTDIVRMRTVGEDPQGEKAARAERISRHMSYQVLEEDEGWEEEMDSLLVGLPIEGCEFKKSWFDPLRGHNVSQWVRPEELVVPYYTRCLEEAPRITHVLSVPDHIVKERQRIGQYLDVELSATVQETSPQQAARDERQGVQPASDEREHTLLEQHCYLDLDEDGYAEPYIVTLHDSGKVLRIVPRFQVEDITFDESRVLKITPFHHFTKYSFIPAPDGGFYDIGFGTLLGPTNESVNTIINQIVDSGTIYNLNSGFLGRGARLKGGNHLFRLGEWKQVDNTGDDLRKSVVPLPVKEPSSVLFQLLGFLVDYGNRLGSVTDIMVGQNPGQNQPATTTMAVLEQGQMVFNGIFKRVHRALRREFRVLYALNRQYLDPQSYFEVLDSGQSATIYQQDYLDSDPKDVRPTADPNMASQAQKLAKAQALREASMSMPGYNRLAVERRFLEALQIPAIDEVLPPNPPPPQPDPKLVIEAEKLKQRQSEQRMKFQFQMQKLELDAHKADAQILKLRADSQLALARAEREGEQADLEAFETGIRAAEERRRSALESLQLMKEVMDDPTGDTELETAPSDG